MSQPTILITGGTGFAGSHLVELLKEKGLTKIQVTTYGSQSSYVSSLLPKNQIHPVDLTNPEQTSGLIAKIKPSQIYHLAALSAVGSSFEKTKSTIENNLLLQLNLLEAVRENSPPARILVIGSAMEYQPSVKPLSEIDPLGPTNPYGISKVIQDLLGLSYCRSYDLDIVRVRPFNHIGERQASGFVVSDFAQQIVKIERGQLKELVVGNLESIRDFTDVKDMVKAYYLLMESGKSGEVYNVGSGKGYTIQQILDLLVSAATTKIKIVVNKAMLRPSDNPKVIANNKKITTLGWKPTIPIEDTLKRVLNYYRDNII